MVTKKLCFIADASSPHTQKWVAGCDSLNWEITVISHRPGVVPGARVIVHPLTLTGFPFYCLKVRRLIRQINPDFIHAHQFGAHGLYAWFSGISPLIISAWGSDILVKPKQSRLIRWLVKFLIRQAALITSDSAQVTAELIKLGAKSEQILTFLFGIPRQTYQRLSATTKVTDKIIICSPRLHEPLYQIGEIIKGYQQIIAEFPQTELWIFGDGSLTASFKEYVTENHIEQRVHFWGRVSPEEFSERVAESHILVSIPTSDGTPVSMLEGMAAGCFPILSDLPVYHDWVEDSVNGFFVGAHYREVSEAFRQSIQEPDLREQAAAKNIKLIAERAIWEEQFQPMLNYYQQLGLQ